MLPYPKNEETPIHLPPRILGIGNAGVHLADRLAMTLPQSVEVVAMNSDAQSLSAAVSPRKAVLGQRATRGLGAGGDPEVGFEAAQESIEEIRFAVEGASTVVIVAGLGGGTGSGAAPVVAAAARDAGAFVLALVTAPFSFEGRRRAAQASEAEAALLQKAHAVIRFQNDRMADLSSPKAGISETFEASDEILTSCVVSFLQMLECRGPMPVTLGNLMAVLRDGSSSALFGRGEGHGDNRAHEALERALRSPLLDRGRMLEEAASVIVHVGGPPSLSYSETAAIMREISKHVPEDANLFLSISTGENSSEPVSVTVFGNHERSAPARPAAAVPVRAAKPTPPPAEPKPPVNRPAPAVPTPAAAVRPPTAAPPRPKEAEIRPKEEISEEDILRPKPPGRLFADEEDLPVSRPPEPVLFEDLPTPQPTPKPGSKKAGATKAKQETLQFEPAARGRFEKSEPTIVEGEDLDIPTFLRARQKP